MTSFNLTEWALGHRALVLFLMLAIVIGGSKTPTSRYRR